MYCVAKMEDIQGYYIKYFTYLILIIGFILGITHVFAIIQSYQIISEYGYNEICKDTFGESYILDDYNPETKMISCAKESGAGVSLKRTVRLD